jgi:hypothetical protein
MSKLSTILDFIETEADERELRAILQAYGTGLRRNRTIMARKLRSELQVGDTVTFVSIKPKYLTGVTAEVLELVGPDKVRVDMGQSIRRYNRIVTAPLSAVRKVS